MDTLAENVALCFRLANERREQLAAIKALVCGDAAPNWPNDPRVTAMRARIADLCDRPVPTVEILKRLIGEGEKR